MRDGSGTGDKPAPAWMYDYYVNGRFYREVDAEAARRVLELVPETHYIANANRGFGKRAVERMAREGVRQFLDIGAGLPAQWCTHEVARKFHPEAAVVYIDYDQQVVDYSNEILRLDGITNVIYVQGDIRDPDSILGNPKVRSVIDFTRPVGQLHAAVWHFVADDENPPDLIRQYIDAVPTGSFLGLSHITSDGQDKAKVQRFLDVYSRSSASVHFRTREQIAELFVGLEFLPPYAGPQPALSFVDLWGSTAPHHVDPAHTWLPAGVAVKR